MIPAWPRNEWAKTGLFTPRIFWPYLGSFDSAARLSLRPGSLRAWIFSLLGSSRAPRQQVLLMMENYACATPITMQKCSQAAVDHFLRQSIFSHKFFGFFFVKLLQVPSFLPLTHNNFNEIFFKYIFLGGNISELMLQELRLKKKKKKNSKETFTITI